MTFRRAVLSLVCASSFVAPAGFADAQQNVDMSALQAEAVRRTREYLRINTVNPPGNEVESMRWFARILKQEGIQFDTATSAPGRGNIWARLPGGSEPALVLLHHMDVVPADSKYWDTDPLAAETRDSVIFGRGALDTKTLGVVQLETFLALKRAKIPLKRDVIFMATADEEAGGNFGAGWVVKNHPEAFKGAGMLLNEGGESALEDDGRMQFAIEVTQKTPLWLKLTSVGRPGHGSTPSPASAEHADGEPADRDARQARYRDRKVRRQLGDAADLNERKAITRFARGGTRNRCTGTTDRACCAA